MQLALPLIPMPGRDERRVKGDGGAREPKRDARPSPDDSFGSINEGDTTGPPAARRTHPLPLMLLARPPGLMPLVSPSRPSPAFSYSLSLSPVPCVLILSLSLPLHLFSLSIPLYISPPSLSFPPPLTLSLLHPPSLSPFPPSSSSYLNLSVFYLTFPLSSLLPINPLYLHRSLS